MLLKIHCHRGSCSRPIPHEEKLNKIYKSKKLSKFSDSNRSKQVLTKWDPGQKRNAVSWAWASLPLSVIKAFANFFAHSGARRPGRKLHLKNSGFLSSEREVQVYQSRWDWRSQDSPKKGRAKNQDKHSNISLQVSKTVNTRRQNTTHKEAHVKLKH